MSFNSLEERLTTGLDAAAEDSTSPESLSIARELRLRCTQAMLLCLDRSLRLAFLLGDVFALSSDEAAEVLEVTPATYRKRLSRARQRLFAFLQNWCGVYRADNPCRCERQVAAATKRGVVDPHSLDLSSQCTQSLPALPPQLADEMGELVRVAEVFRRPSAPAQNALVVQLRSLVKSGRFSLL